jgi:hypothetical protein
VEFTVETLDEAEQGKLIVSQTHDFFLWEGCLLSKVVLLLLPSARLLLPQRCPVRIVEGAYIVNGSEKEEECPLLDPCVRNVGPESLWTPVSEIVHTAWRDR